MKGLGSPPAAPSGVIIWLGIDSRTGHLGALWQACPSFFQGREELVAGEARPGWKR